MQTAAFLKDLFDLSGKTAVIIGGTGELCGTIAVASPARVRRSSSAAASPRKPRSASRKSNPTAERATSSLSMSLPANRSMISLRPFSKNPARSISSSTAQEPTRPRRFSKSQKRNTSGSWTANLSAVFRACQVFGKYFLDESRTGSIINLGSISGLNPLSRVFTYSASKAALHNLTRNLAREWADQDIRVNTLVPGFFPAEQNRKVLDETRVLDILRQTPASRFGNAEELIGATLLLASSKAGSFITGTEMIVDGGFQAMTI